MRVVSPSQMREIDTKTIKNIGIPGAVLMENAAISSYIEIVKSIGPVEGKRILVLAGKGNNGGDAFAVSRHLSNNRALIKIICFANKNEIKGDAKTNLDIVVNMGLDITWIKDEKGIGVLKKNFDGTELIVDGIFGTGFKGKTQGAIHKAIKLINSSDIPVISLDIPSGVNGDTGKVEGKCIKAIKTVTFGLLKKGLLLHPACEYTGEIVVAKITIPEKVYLDLDIKINTIDSKYVSKILPKRVQDSNKSDYGKVLFITGSSGMTGAGCLAGEACLRIGAGLVYLAVPSSLTAIYETAFSESVVLPMKDDNKGYFLKDSLKELVKQIKKTDTAVIGPGMSINSDIQAVVKGVISNSKVPLVLDADALNAVSKDVSMLSKKSSDIVITPHPGEMARLAETSSKQVQDDRINTAVEFSKKWGVITVLKGSRTLVVSPKGEIYINLTGNSGMSTAGSGDVLSGIISGLIGQGMNPYEASVAGVYIHGAAGDIAAEEKGEHGMIAGDIVEMIPDVINDILQNKK